MILGDIEVGIMTNVTTPQQMFERIEVCGRICYKSQHLIQYDEKGHSTTARDFVERICNVNKHRSIAEHGTVYLTVPYYSHHYSQMLEFYNKNPYSKVRIYPDFKNIYITTNYRVLLDNDRLKDMQYWRYEEKEHWVRSTFYVKAPISVTREIRTHRALSTSEMSTRYCNFTKDKFDSQLTFYCPTPDIIDYEFLQRAEEAYFNKIKGGAKPQEARELLPLCTMSEVYYTAFDDDWAWFLYLRCSEKAHPYMQKVANYIDDCLYEECKD
jgi:thymidylate synthase (FAD)